MKDYGQIRVVVLDTDAVSRAALPRRGESASKSQVVYIAPSDNGNPMLRLNLLGVLYGRARVGGK